MPSGSPHPTAEHCEADQSIRDSVTALLRVRPSRPSPVDLSHPRTDPNGQCRLSGDSSKGQAQLTERLKLGGRAEPSRFPPRAETVPSLYPTLVREGVPEEVLDLALIGRLHEEDRLPEFKLLRPGETRVAGLDVGKVKLLKERAEGAATSRCHWRLGDS